MDLNWRLSTEFLDSGQLNAFSLICPLTESRLSITLFPEEAWDNENESPWQKWRELNIYFWAQTLGQANSLMAHGSVVTLMYIQTSHTKSSSTVAHNHRIAKSPPRCHNPVRLHTQFPVISTLVLPWDQLQRLTKFLQADIFLPKGSHILWWLGSSCVCSKTNMRYVRLL